MEIKEVKCVNCGKDIYVLEDHVRAKMFCTIGCMDTFNKVPKNHGKNS